MKYLKYCRNDCLNGKGIRCVIWLSQCNHGCKNCFNKDSWGNVGEVVTRELKDKILQDLNKPYIKGFTWSGGDPLHKRNYEEVIEFSKEIKSTFPEKDIWLWTGYTLLEVQSDSKRNEVLHHIDYLMDGKYEKSNPTTKPFRGSANQCLYSLENGVPTLID